MKDEHLYNAEQKRSAKGMLCMGKAKMLIFYNSFKDYLVHTPDLIINSFQITNINLQKC